MNVEAERQRRNRDFEVVLQLLVRPVPHVLLSEHQVLHFHVEGNSCGSQGTEVRGIALSSTSESSLLNRYRRILTQATFTFPQYSLLGSRAARGEGSEGTSA